MVTEKIEVQDNMSASLQRIAKNTEMLYQRMEKLKLSIAGLEKPTTLTSLRRSLRETEKDIKNNIKAAKQLTKQMEEADKAKLRAQLKAQKENELMQRAMQLNQQLAYQTYRERKAYNPRTGKRDLVRYDTSRPITRTPFTVGKNDLWYVGGQPIKNADRPAFAERFIAQHQLDQARREASLIRTTNRAGRKIGSLDERIARVNNHRAEAEVRTTRQIERTGSNLMRLDTALFRVAGTIASLSIITDTLRAAFEKFVEPSSQYIAAYNRASLVSDKKQTTGEMMNRLYDTAIRTRADSEGTFMLYNRIAMSGVKASNERIRRFVETFNKTMMISGTTKQENRAVMLQLAQGLGSNRLGGDEFRSIAEQAPMFKYMLARGLGVNPGQLKQMGAKGDLTADVIMDAMEKEQDLIDKLAKNAPLTIDQELIVLQDRWDKFITSSQVGYMAIRDALVAFDNWMQSSKGKEVMNELLQTWNTGVVYLVQTLKWVAQPLLWIIEHLKLVRWVIKSIGIIWLTLSWRKWIDIAWLGLRKVQHELVMLGMKTDTAKVCMEVLADGTEVAASRMSLAISGVGALITKWLPQLFLFATIADAVTNFVPETKRGIERENYVKSKLTKKYGKNSNARYLSLKSDADSVYKVNTGIGWLDKSIRVIGKIPNLPGVLDEKIAGHISGPNGKYTLWKRDYADFSKTWEKNHPKMGSPEWYAKMQAESDAKMNKAQKAVESKMDSSKNKEMPPEIKGSKRGGSSKKGTKVNGGHLDSVGRINDKVSIDNDGIEMMKMIAERQWIMQNEVTVPQKVDINVSNNVEMSAEELANSLNKGTKRAVAATMRGAAVTL